MSYLGTTKLGKIYLGSTEIAKAYLGETLVFQNGGGPTPPSPLPTGYTRLSYVENPLGNSAYINTGIKTYPQLGFHIDAMSYDNLSGTGYGCLFGGRYSSGSSDFQLTSYSSSNYSGTIRTGNGSGINAHLPAKNTRFVAELVGTTYSIDGIDYTITYNVASGRSKDIYLFALNNNGSVVQNGHFRVYAYWLTRDGNKIIDYVPSKDPNDVVGFYDLVNSVFVPPTSGTLVGVE